MTRITSLLAAFVATASLAGSEIRLSAKQLYDMGACTGMRLSDDGAHLERERGTLSEGDGPAAGYSYKPNEEKLSATTRIKKELFVDGPARKATLLVAPGGKLDAIINGKPFSLPAPEKIGSYWQGYDIPPELLVTGKNEIVLHGAGKLWIARDEDFALGSTSRTKHPNLSAKSSDGGKTWTYDKLGTRDDMDGEYYVRLALDQPVARGMVLLPALDTAADGAAALAAPLERLGPIKVRVVLAADKDASVVLHAKTAATPDLAELDTSKEVGIENRELTIDAPRGRYLQLRVVVAGTSNARLREIVVSSEHPRGENWTGGVKLAGIGHAPLVVPPVSLVHECHDHPRLKELRARYKLDDVIKGAKDDIELMGRLAGWASRQFSKMHLRDSYPPWDALEILKPHADGTPVGGFCQQYNIVLLQACQSFGLVGRAVSIGPGDHGDKIRSGHEVVEIWSDDHGKWVYIDGQKAWLMVDDASGVPLSLLDLHQRQMATLAGKNAPPVRCVKWSDTAPEWGGLDSFPPFVELRLIPRSNFLSEPTPLPLNQGMRGWFWTGHHVWASDPPQRSSLLYSQFLRHPLHWNGPVNQVHLMLEPTTTRNQVRAHFVDPAGTKYRAFVVRTANETPREVTTPWVLWNLQGGDNRLEVRPKTASGRTGAVSWVAVRN
jgi:hypothetical protein